jgi:hypothetical protein
LAISEKTKIETLWLESSVALLNAKKAAMYGDLVQSRSGEGNP